MSEVSNEILIDRASIRAMIVFAKIRKMLTRATENPTKRTTINCVTLEDLKSDLKFLNETLDQIKY